MSTQDWSFTSRRTTVTRRQAEDEAAEGGESDGADADAGGPGQQLAATARLASTRPDGEARTTAPVDAPDEPGDQHQHRAARAGPARIMSLATWRSTSGPRSMFSMLRKSYGVHAAGGGSRWTGPRAGTLDRLHPVAVAVPSAQEHGDERHQGEQGGEHGQGAEPAVEAVAHVRNSAGVTASSKARENPWPNVFYMSPWGPPGVVHSRRPNAVQRTAAHQRRPHPNDRLYAVELLLHASFPAPTDRACESTRNLRDRPR